jgi:hypothetical protein
MPKGTNQKGSLNPINECKLEIPGGETIVLDNLPTISDTKSAQYNAESIIGRSSPLHTYHYSDTRVISISFHFFIVNKGDGAKNIDHLRAICSCSYPREGDSNSSFVPPPICKFKCGKLLAEEDLCVVLQSYNVRFPDDVAWDAETLCPYKFDVDTTWWVVYNSSDLPYMSRILRSGR